MSVELTAGNTLRSRNPATLEVVGEVAVSGDELVRSSVLGARQAFATWGALCLRERLASIERFRETLYKNKDGVAELITREAGKPLVESLGAEVFGALETCSWLKKNAPRLLSPQRVALNRLFFSGKRSYNTFEPLGVVAVISPWNYPFSIPVSTMLTAVAAGNTVVLKPSPKTPLVSRRIAELFAEAGFPAGVVSVVYGDRQEARTLVLSDVDRVVFTGSVAGGKAIMALAAERLHPVTLELGGKHAAIVLEDVDVERVAPAIVWAAFTNAGQACASIERLYVARPVARELARKVAELTRSLRLGNGLDPESDVGPLIDEEQLGRVERQVSEAVSGGARVIAGGRARRDLGGYFFEPTVLVNVDESMSVIAEETFGPVLPVVVVEDADQAVHLCNNSRLGLGASIWTADLKRAQRLARRIQSGMVWVNDGLYSHACPDAPWGGIKDSGFGRTHGAHALYEFVNIKHIGVDRQGARDWNHPYTAERLALVRSGVDLCHGSGLWLKLKAILNLLPAWWATRRRQGS